MGKSLPAFNKGGRVPSAKDVLLHLFFHMESMTKRNVSMAVDKTADNLLEVWKPNYIPVKASQKVRTKIKRLNDEYMEVKKSINAVNPKAISTRECFVNSLDERFDISAANADEKIKGDKTLTCEDRREDLNFLENIRKNLPHALGVLDGKRKKRLKLADERAVAQEERLAKECDRQQVCRRD